jgi:hypothetical protein
MRGLERGIEDGGWRGLEKGIEDGEWEKKGIWGDGRKEGSGAGRGGRRRDIEGTQEMWAKNLKWQLAMRG